MAVPATAKLMPVVLPVKVAARKPSREDDAAGDGWCRSERDRIDGGRTLVVVNVCVNVCVGAADTRGCGLEETSPPRRASVVPNATRGAPVPAVTETTACPRRRRSR